MSGTKEITFKIESNPLNEFEDMLESSGYDYDRVTKTRLHFECEGKQGSYGIMLEWNDNSNIIKCSLVITATKSIPQEMLITCISQANESAWHGFFIIDGVGNSVFKSLFQYNDLSLNDTIDGLEKTIDSAIKEADRFSISLALSNDNEMPSLFQKDEDWTLENLTLMFSETKGNA